MTDKHNDDLTEAQADRREAQDNRREAQEVRRDTRRREKRAPFILLLGVILLSIILTGCLAIVYTGYSQQRSDRRWCDLLHTLNAPGQPAPESERGKQIQRQLRQLERDFHC